MPNVLLSQYLPPAHISIPLRARTFKDALAEMVAKLVALGVVRDVAELEHALASARGRDVVTIGPDVALPHFRTEAVDDLIVSLGVAPQPLDPGDSGLDMPPRVIALVIAPPEAAALYLQTVAALAHFFQGGEVLARLQDATSAADVVRMLPELSSLRIQPQLTVSDLMTHDTPAVAPDADARSAVDIMVGRRLRALPVVNQGGELIGIVTEWDVMRALLPHIPRVADPDEAVADLTVRDVMTRSVLGVPEEMGLEEAVNLMINKKVEQCPVVRDSVFVGMLTRSDIIRKLFAR
ncbi:MAG: CBS domain-containing protein [Gemmatimonadota bacterium]